MCNWNIFFPFFFTLLLRAPIKFHIFFNSSWVLNSLTGFPQGNTPPEPLPLFLRHKEISKMCVKERGVAQKFISRNKISGTWYTHKIQHQHWRWYWRSWCRSPAGPAGAEMIQAGPRPAPCIPPEVTTRPPGPPDQGGRSSRWSRGAVSPGAGIRTWRSLAGSRDFSSY